MQRSEDELKEHVASAFREIRSGISELQDKIAKGCDLPTVQKDLLDCGNAVDALAEVVRVLLSERH